jgi:hypothetical protein
VLDAERLEELLLTYRQADEVAELDANTDDSAEREEQLTVCSGPGTATGSSSPRRVATTPLWQVWWGRRPLW